MSLLVSQKLAPRRGNFLLLHVAVVLVLHRTHMSQEISRLLETALLDILHVLESGQYRAIARQIALFLVRIASVRRRGDLGKSHDAAQGVEPHAGEIEGGSEGLLVVLSWCLISSQHPSIEHREPER